MTFDDILSLTITEKEGEIPEALIEVPNDTFLRVGEMVTLESVFVGEVMGVVRTTIHTTTWRLLARAQDHEARRTACVYSLKGAPYEEELLQHGASFDYLMDLHLKTIFYDRITHDVRLSDLFHGREKHEFHTVFEDGFAYEKVGEPLQNVEVTVTAQWVQTIEGAMDLGPQLGGVIETLDGERLMQKWWRTGTMLRGNNYRVLKGHLEERGSKVFQMGDVPLTIRSFVPTLIMGWYYRQKRHETFSFKLENARSDSTGSIKNLDLALRPVTMNETIQPWVPDVFYAKGGIALWEGQFWEAKSDHMANKTFEEIHWISRDDLTEERLPKDSASFFLHPRGRRVAAHALLLARTYLAHSSRVYQVRCCVPWEEGVKLSVDHTIVLRDARLTDGIFEGKVTSLILVADGLERYAKLTACSVGGAQILMDVGLQDYSAQTPQQGVLNRIQEIGILEQVGLENCASEQIAYLQQTGPYATESRLRQEIVRVPTNLRVRLKDLSQMDCLYHQIHAHPTQRWGERRGA